MMKQWSRPDRGATTFQSTNEEQGGPSWKQVLFRTTTDAETGNAVEIGEQVHRLDNASAPLPTPAPPRLPTTLYYETQDGPVFEVA